MNKTHTASNCYTMTNNTTQTKTEWLDGNLPFSTRFDDTYFTRSDGLAETSHVFIAGNRLHERWGQMSQCTIGELGFGTGLNFLETVRQWQEISPAGATLQYISYEQYPLAGEDILRALSRWEVLDELAQSLVASWSTSGNFFKMKFSKNIKLKVNFGDANTLLPQCAQPIDAWYLDGFSPAKNPELWNSTLLKQVFAATKSGGKFATYTAAGFVRRNLQAAGFKVLRTKGFDTKREMLSGYRQ